MAWKKSLFFPHYHCRIYSENTKGKQFGSRGLGVWNRLRTVQTDMLMFETTHTVNLVPLANILTSSMNFSVRYWFFNKGEHNSHDPMLCYIHTSVLVRPERQKLHTKNDMRLTCCDVQQCWKNCKYSQLPTSPVVLDGANDKVMLKMSDSDNMLSDHRLKGKPATIKFSEMW